MLANWTVWQWNFLPWYALGIYWAIGALRVKRTKSSESVLMRALTIIPMLLAFELLFSDRLHLALLQSRFVPAEPWIQWSGFAINCAGAALAIWARYCLGQYWSGLVTIKENHRVIRSGPYRFIRHPIYAGILLGCIGTAVVFGEWRGLLGVLVIYVTHTWKASREEAMLTAELGTEYTEYSRRTGALLPRFTRSN